MTVKQLMNRALVTVLPSSTLFEVAPEDERASNCQEAIDVCPVQAISWSE